MRVAVLIFSILLLINCSSLMYDPRFRGKFSDQEIFLTKKLEIGEDVSASLGSVKITHENFLNETFTHFAVKGGNLNLVKKVIEMGSFKDSKSVLGETPLLIAVKLQYPKIVEYLLSIGCNINFQDNFRDPIFFYTLENKNSEILDILIKYHFNPNLVGFVSKTWSDFDFEKEKLKKYVLFFSKNNPTISENQAE